jgi:hypothetical protein
VTLPVPLWGRALTDGTGRAIPYIDGRKLLAPPPTTGWHLVQLSPSGQGSELTGATERFSSSHSGEMSLTEYDSPIPGLPGGMATMVRGVSGILSQYDLSWPEHGHTMVLTAHGTATGPELVDFANSLR